MKRYWKIISIAIVVVLTIGSFYMQSSLAKATYPSFHIETISGDEEVLKNITVIGHYSEKDKGEVRSEISESETSYSPNYYSYIDVLKGDFAGEKVKEYQKQYRNFMRGKVMEDNLVENEEDLVYAEINIDWSSDFFVSSATFEIDILHKNSKQSSSFSAPIPLESQVEHLYISHVDMFEDTLQIITDSMIYSDNGQENHLHMYRLDIVSGKLLSEQRIDFSEDNTNDGNLSIYPLIDRSEGNSSKYVVFVANEYEIVEMTEGSYDDVKLNQEVVVYNMETDQQEKMELPEEIDLEFQVDSLVDNTIYFTKERDDEFQVIGYNLDNNNQKEVDYKIDLNQGPGDERVTAYLMDTYISIVSPLKSKLVDAVIKVGDVKTGDIFYEGSVEIDPDQQAGDYRLDISHIMMD